MARALLVCAGGGIGDSLLASVCARALRQKFEAVDALTLPAHRETLERVPDVCDVLVDDRSPMDRLCANVRGRAYDACVITWASRRNAEIAVRAGIPVRVGQSHRLYSALFTHRVDVRSERGDVTTHWTQILLDYPRAIGCDTPDALPAFTVRDGDWSEAQALLRSRDISEPFAIVHPTCAVSPRRPFWPVEGWATLAAELRKRYGVRILVSGSAADAGIARALAEQAGAESIAGATPIGAFAALAQRAEFFIVMHNGAMHVAAAAGARTVGIFPLQADFPDRWAPLGPRVAVVRATYRCRPGERIETCPDYLCVRNLATARVLAALDELLAREAKHAS